MVQRCPHWRLILTTVFHGLAGNSVFFYTTVLNPIESRVKDLANQSIIAHYGVEHSEQTLQWVWAATSTSQIIGALIGCATVKYPAEKFGRRNTVMILKNLILITASVIQFLSQPLNSIELLIIGRILSGIAFTQTFLIPVLLAESSPTEFRGLVSSAPSLGSRIWALSGALLPLLDVFNSETTWNYLLLCPAIPAIIHFLGTPLFPESIKYLYITKKYRKLSQISTTFYHGPDADTEELQNDMDNEADISPTIEVANIHVLLAASQFRRPAVLCLVAMLMIPVGGDNIISHYSTGMLRSAGISHSEAPLFSALFIQLPVFVVSLLVVAFLEKFGRRPLLLVGVGLSILGTCSLGLATVSEKIDSILPPILSIAGLCLTVLGLTVGPNLISPVLPGELAPTASRCLTFGISRFFGTVISLILGFVFPPLHQAIGSYCLLPLTFLGILGFIFLFKFLPESKGKTVYNIVQPWMPKRKIGRKWRKSEVETTAFNEIWATNWGITRIASEAEVGTRNVSFISIDE